MMVDQSSVETPGRARKVATLIRDKILQGRYARGAQLPTFDQLVDEFGISRATMQQTIRQLKEEGFVRSVHRSGLFVADAPPHLHRFGLLFESAPGESSWNRFMAALLAEAPVAMRGRASDHIAPFLNICETATGLERARMVDEARVHRLAGLIITHGTAWVLKRPEIRQSGVPCVAINYVDRDLPGTPVINTDEPLFYRKALAWLASRGRKRVAVLAMRQYVGVTPGDCAAAGLATRPHWLCPVGGEFPGQTKTLVQLLLDQASDQRPDALVIATDHLVEEALATLVDSGVAIGRDIDVVAHCNWPWPVESPLPITRLGFHAHDFLRTAVDLVGMIRRGETPPPRTLIPALFEHELNPENRG